MHCRSTRLHEVDIIAAKIAATPSRPSLGTRQFHRCGTGTGTCRLCLGLRRLPCPPQECCDASEAAAESGALWRDISHDDNASRLNAAAKSEGLHIRGSERAAGGGSGGRSRHEDASGSAGLESSQDACFTEDVPGVGEEGQGGARSAAARSCQP
jgi:hypothetical protein